MSSRINLLRSATSVLAICCVFGIGACAKKGDPIRPALIPSNWIDLPQSPLVAKLMRERGERKWHLVNRSSRNLDTMSTGCVVERDGKVAIVATLFQADIFDSRVRPGQSFSDSALEQLATLDQDRERIRATVGVPTLLPPCPAESKFAVVSAGVRGGYMWSAEGTSFPAITKQPR